MFVKKSKSSLGKKNHTAASDAPLKKKKVKVEEVEEVEETEMEVEEPEMEVEEAETEEDTSEDIGVDLDVDKIADGICSNMGTRGTAVYQIQVRMPAEMEPIYKALSPKVRKALRDAFVSMVEKTYARLK